jgi:biopolymer transport protein ExbB/TolQ
MTPIYLPLNQLPLAGIVYSFEQSNWAGRIIVLVLLVGSVFAWSLMLTKAKSLRLAAFNSRLFLSAYRQEANATAVFLKRRKYEPSPLFSIYEKACRSLGAEIEARGADPDDLFMGGVGANVRGLGQRSVGAVRNVAERSMADHVLLFEDRMGLVATAASTAPFLGLLGTVWGVMESFGGMAMGGAAMLSAVAPGISGALLTTVVGLLVALPSAVGYNLLSDSIRRTSVEMDNFVDELMADVERQYQDPE